MRSTATETNVMDFEKARTLAIVAIDKYLAGDTLIGDRDGTFHGTTGKRRADLAKRHLESLTAVSDNKNSGILTVMLAIFGKNRTGLFQLSLGRSSRLAGLIAEKWIEGVKRYGTYIGNNDPLRSDVFSADALNQAVSNDNNTRFPSGRYATYSYFDHTEGVRDLLNMALNGPEFQHCKNDILRSAEKLRSQFEASACEIKKETEKHVLRL